MVKQWGRKRKQNTKQLNFMCFNKMAVDEQCVRDFRSEESNPSIRIVDDFLELTLGHLAIFVNRHLMPTDTNFFHDCVRYGTRRIVRHPGNTRRSGTTWYLYSTGSTSTVIAR